MWHDSIFVETIKKISYIGVVRLEEHREKSRRLYTMRPTLAVSGIVGMEAFIHF